MNFIDIIFIALIGWGLAALIANIFFQDPEMTPVVFVIATLPLTAYFYLT